jgi:hypothetical protein
LTLRVRCRAVRTNLTTLPTVTAAGIAAVIAAAVVTAATPRTAATARLITPNVIV